MSPKSCQARTPSIPIHSLQCRVGLVGLKEHHSTPSHLGGARRELRVQPGQALGFGQRVLTSL